MFKYSLIILSLVVTIFGQGYKITFKTISIEQGLSQNTVYSIVQDKRGLIWIGLQDGLNCYDANDIRVFLYDPNDPKSINSNNVSYLHNSNKGELYFCTWGGGLGKLNYEENSFIAYKNDPSDFSTLSHNRLSCILEDEKGNFWIGTAGGGLNYFNPQSLKAERYMHKENDTSTISHNRIWGIAQDQGKNLWIATNSGINHFNITTKKNIRIFPNVVDSKKEKAYYTRSIFVDKKGKIWCGTEDGVYIYDPVRKIFEEHIILNKESNNFKSNIINCFFEIDENRMMIGTSGDGLYIIDRSKSFTEHFINDPMDAYSISGNDIRTIFRDKQGQYWIGTRGSGVSITSLMPDYFQSYTNTKAGNIQLSGKNVYSTLFDEKGKLWVGTYDNGLNLIDLINQTSLQVRIENNGLKEFKHRIYFLHQDSDGIIWVLTDIGMKQILKGKDVLSEIKDSDIIRKGIIKEEFRSLYNIPGKLLLLGTYGRGLFIYNYKTKELIRCEEKFRGIGGNEIYYIHYSNDRTFWINTNNGLLNYDPEKETLNCYGTEISNKFILKNLYSWSICETKDNTLWIATSKGLKKFDKISKKIITFTSENGIGSDIVNSVVEDNFGVLWLATNKGITSFSTAGNSIRNYTKEGGLLQNLYNPHSASISNEGKIAFGGVNGITIVNPEKIRKNSYIPPVIITKFLFSVEGKLENLIKSVGVESFNKPIELGYDQNYITFAFTALNYLYPEKNQFKFRIKELDTNWQEGLSGHNIMFSGLAPGKYTFNVIASNNDGIWNEKGATIEFIINPPFYATNLFRGIVVLLLIFGVISFVKIRENRHKANQQKLEKTVELRTLELKESERQLKESNKIKDKFFSIISHDLRSPFQGLINLSKILKYDYYSLDDAKRLIFINELEKASTLTFNLVENLLLWSRTQSNTLVVKKVQFEFGEIIDEHFKLFDQLARNKGIILNNISNENLKVFADKDMVVFVLRNIFTNAVKFTPKNGQITITTEETASHAIVKIIDTGIGMSQETIDRIYDLSENYTSRGTDGEKGSGLGIKLCLEFLKLNSSTLNVESKSGEGTTFTITIPSTDYTGNSTENSVPL